MGKAATFKEKADMEHRSNEINLLGNLYHFTDNEDAKSSLAF